ncbi:GtrA family protein [Modestobacter marinus]|uniref:GtrA family protein n=1 Tax=Modestobacter marinus TaxID=477641 RepID=UPI0027DF7DF5|nr:GtrA family protein [Modestobacter marinus]
MHVIPRLLDRAGVTWRILLKELSAFGVVGALCFVVDLGLFQLLYAHVGVGAVTSKLLATLVSMTLAYFGHRYWSFSHRARTGLRREYSIFFLVNGVTLLLGLLLVAIVRYPLGQEGALALQVTNVVSIGLGTVIRFLAYRRWVFVSSDAPAAVAHQLDRERRESAAQQDAPAAA